MHLCVLLPEACVITQVAREDKVREKRLVFLFQLISKGLLFSIYFSVIGLCKHTHTLILGSFTVRLWPTLHTHTEPDSLLHSDCLSACSERCRKDLPSLCEEDSSEVSLLIVMKWKLSIIFHCFDK